jgi:hypothetical protein
MYRLFKKRVHMFKQGSYNLCFTGYLLSLVAFNHEPYFFNYNFATFGKF